MKIPLASALDLLHTATYGTLATHSVQLPGYPFATALPFAPDEQHCPLFLISALAEHTHNLHADPRASLLLVEPGQPDILAGARLTLVGDVQPFAPTEAQLARYLRYQPDAEQYLALGDFTFFRLQPKRLRLIAGFGRMGWIEADEMRRALALAPDEEAVELAALPSLPPAARWLGLDVYGADLEQDGLRLRLSFAIPADSADARHRAVADALAAR
ncbi:HugZ family protein [Crenobacter cavernae]|nr:pyridoxamine 5'-phosphate oxidase family protein [Crenobacter cavernae]